MKKLFYLLPFVFELLACNGGFKGVTQPNLIAKNDQSGGNNGGTGTQIGGSVNYYEYLVRRWNELGMETRQIQALAEGGQSAVTAIHARWLITVIKELAAVGMPVGVEHYHNPVPNTNWYFSNDIILLNEGGHIFSIDVIVGRDNWTQGDPGCLLGNPTPADWRDLFSHEFDGIEL